ncbi:MAG: hypothetical protein ABI724_06530 [Betaproteobacteria bacterium]
MQRIPLQFMIAILTACTAISCLAGVEMPRSGKFDFNFCFAADSNYTAFTDKAGLGSFTNVAAIHSRQPGGPFDLQGAHCFGYFSNVEGQYSESGYCEMQDTDGDKWIMKFDTGADAVSGSWKAVAGTGKYDGLAATGAYQPLGNVPSAVAGKVARCNRNTGSYQMR